MGVGANCQGNAGERTVVGTVPGECRGVQGNSGECRGIQGNARETYGSVNCQGNAGNAGGAGECQEYVWEWV